MKNPKEQIQSVNISVEYSIPDSVLDGPDGGAIAKHLIGFSSFQNQEEDSFIFSLDGTTEDFKKQLGKYGDNGCPQHIISYHKHARDLGAKWMILTLTVEES